MFLKYKKIIIASSLFLSLNTAKSADIELTIDKVVNLAIENSKLMNSSKAKVKSAKASVSELETNLLPKLNFTGSYTRLSDVKAFAFDPADVFPGVPSNPVVLNPIILDNFFLRLQVAQPIFTGFAISNAIESQEMMAKSSELDLANQEKNISLDAKTYFWTLYKAKRMLKVTEDNVRQLESHYERVKNMVEQGLLTDNDRLKVSVQLSDAKMRKLDAENGVQMATVYLNNMLGLDLTTTIELKTEELGKNNSNSSINELILFARENRKDIGSMEYMVKAAESGYEASKSGYYPQIALTGNLYYNNPNQRIMPNEANFQSTWDVGISLSYDIWNWNQTTYKSEKAEAQMIQAKESWEYMVDMTNVEVTQSVLNLENAKKKISATELTKQQTEENLRSTNDKFYAGLVPTTDLIDAEFYVLQAKLNYENTLADYEIAKAKLEKATGK